LNKLTPFLDFRGHRIRYLLIFNENILFLHEIVVSESVNVFVSDLFTQLTEPLSANVHLPYKINSKLRSYKSLDYEIPNHVKGTFSVFSNRPHVSSSVLSLDWKESSSLFSIRCYTFNTTSYFVKVDNYWMCFDGKF
jgi:hypothetical protein